MFQLPKHAQIMCVCVISTIGDCATGAALIEL